MDKRRTALWVAFWAFVLLTFAVDRFAWMMEWQSPLRLVLAIISFLVAWSLLVFTERSWRRIVAISIGLIAAFWWLVMKLLVFAAWGFGDYRP